jgi:hypothetical protein
VVRHGEDREEGGVTATASKLVGGDAHRPRAVPASSACAVDGDGVGLVVA